MTLVVPNIALNYIQNDILNRTFKLRLYSNNLTPDATTTFASFTEVIGGGYAEIDLPYADAVITDGTAVWPQQTFTFTSAPTGPSTVYGVYIVDDSNHSFIWAEKFPVSVLPFNPVAGSTVKVTPKLIAA